MNPLADQVFQVFDLFAAGATDRSEAARLSDLLESRAEAVAYLLLRHEAVSTQPAVAASLGKLAAQGLAVRNEHSLSTAHTANPAEIDKARADLRAALRGLIDHDLRSLWAGDAVAERRRSVETCLPSGSLSGLMDRVRR